jgi:hypothetical protein
MTAFLLERGADPTMANAAGVSAIEAARARGLLDAAELMEEHLTVRADR